MQKAFTTESATAAVVKIILEESGAGDVVNSRILNVFQKKISVLQKALILTYEQGRRKITGKVVERLENRTEISI